MVDVIYTQEPNEVTEVICAERFKLYNVNISYIESNAGGRAFARNVERICRDIGNNKTSIKTFHQSKNKQARIKSNSSTVMNTVVFPDNWAVKWPQYYDAMTGYLATGSNKIDDAPDATTGIVEKSDTKPKIMW